jgi:putative copper resistance protein D
VIEAGLIGARFLHYAALVLLFGGWAYAGFRSADVVLGRRLDRLIVISALLVLIGSGAVLAATVAGLGGGYGSLADTALWASIFADTDFGQIWSVRLILALLSVAVALAWRYSHGGFVRLTGLVFAGALLVTVAWTGHAAVEEGATGALHRGADALHLVAAAVWLGALGPLLWLLARKDDSADAARRLSSFHAVGLAAVVTLIATGLINSFFLVDDPLALITTRYGQLLGLKVMLFALMIWLAARNRLSHTPALTNAISDGTDPGMASARLRRSIGGELALGTVVLAIAAVLGAIEPAASV